MAHKPTPIQSCRLAAHPTYLKGSEAPSSYCFNRLDKAVAPSLGAHQLSIRVHYAHHRTDMLSLQLGPAVPKSSTLIDLLGVFRSRRSKYILSCSIGCFSRALFSCPEELCMGLFFASLNLTSALQGRAWQTTFATYIPVRKGRTIVSDPAYGLILQLPLQGALEKSGVLNFVLKRPSGENPEWLQSTGNRDFQLSLKHSEVVTPSSEPTRRLDNPCIACACVIIGDSRTYSPLARRRHIQTDQWLEKLVWCLQSSEDSGASSFGFPDAFRSAFCCEFT